MMEREIMRARYDRQSRAPLSVGMTLSELSALSAALARSATRAAVAERRLLSAERAAMRAERALSEARADMESACEDVARAEMTLSDARVQAREEWTGNADDIERARNYAR